MIIMFKNIYYKLIEITIYRLLQLSYGYDSWHNYAYQRKPYAVDIVSFINRIEHINSAVELGCGTGDIIRRLKLSRRYAGDIDTRCLRSLAFYNIFSKNRKKIETFQYECGAISLAEKFDIIIMCNWLHNIEPTKIENEFRILIDKHLTPGGYLIFDAVNNDGYKYFHDINSFTIFQNMSSQTVNVYENGRIIYCVQKVKSSESDHS